MLYKLDNNQCYIKIFVMIILHLKQVWLWNILASEIEYAKLVSVSTSVKGGLCSK